MNNSSASSSSSSDNQLTGRKGHKFLKGKKEPVWPPRLEAALLEGLERYMPTSTKDPRTLQRFPRRNQEISNFILRTTGEHRTAKQVGSRLQQLRESCSDEHILNLIQNKVFGADRDRRRRSTPYFNSASDAFWDSLSQPCSSPTQVHVPASNSASVPSNVVPRTPVIISLYEFDMNPSSPTISSTPTFTLDLDEEVLVEASPSSPSPCSSSFTRRGEIRTSSTLSQCSPIVNLSSRKFSTASRFRCTSDIYCNGELVSSSASYLEPCMADYSSTSFSCRAFFVPEFWSILATNEDYRAFSITQNISAESNGRSSTLFILDYVFESGFDIQNYTYQSSPQLSYPDSPTYRETLTTTSSYDYYPQSAYQSFDNASMYPTTSHAHQLPHPSSFDLPSASVVPIGYESTYASFY